MMFHLLGDFPDLERFRAHLREYDLSKFPKLKQQLLDDMETVLSRDVPRLMEKIAPPPEPEARYPPSIVFDTLPTRLME